MNTLRPLKLQVKDLLEEMFRIADETGGTLNPETLSELIHEIYSDNPNLHITQKKILSLVENGVDVKNLTLREVGAKVGVNHPQKVAHHIQFLLNNGYLDLVRGKYQIPNYD